MAELLQRGDPGWGAGGDPDRDAMRVALEEAERAWREGEVPVGAVIVHPELGLIGRAHNARERLQQATAHAELLALAQACSAVGSWRLEDAVLYATLEPCAMCAGALIQARVARLVFGARDPKAGAVESVTRLLEPGLFHHDVPWTGGVMAEECGALLSRFFQERRAEGKK